MDSQASDIALAIAPNLSRMPLSQIICYQCGEKGHFQANCPHVAAAAAPPTTSCLAGCAAAITEDSDSEVDGVW